MYRFRNNTIFYHLILEIALAISAASVWKIETNDSAGQGSIEGFIILFGVQEVNTCELYLKR